MTVPVVQLSDFSLYLNKSFAFQTADAPAVQAELIEAALLENAYALEDAPRQGFSLVFKLADGVELGQGSYDLSCDDQTWPMVFLVPIIMPRQGRFMQAIFN